MTEIRICALPNCPNPVERSNQAYCCKKHRQLAHIHEKRRQRVEKAPFEALAAPDPSATPSQSAFALDDPENATENSGPGLMREVHLLGSWIAHDVLTGQRAIGMRGNDPGTTKSSIPVLCRQLKKLGLADDSDIIHVTRAGEAVWKRDLPLSWWAERDCGETRKRSVHWIWYKPHPRALTASVDPAEAAETDEFPADRVNHVEQDAEDQALVVARLNDRWRVILLDAREVQYRHASWTTEPPYGSFCQTRAVLLRDIHAKIVNLPIDPQALAIIEALPERSYTSTPATAFVERTERDEVIFQALSTDQDRQTRMFGQIRMAPVLYAILVPHAHAVNELNLRWFVKAGGDLVEATRLGIQDFHAEVREGLRSKGIAPLTENELVAMLRKRGFYTWGQNFEPDKGKRKSA